MKFVIAIDGPAAAGKGTIAAKLVKKFKFAYLDTGLLYRAVASKSLNEGVKPEIAASNLTQDDLMNSNLRDPVISKEASKVAIIPEVRSYLHSFQTEFSKRSGGVILDGRDIGTVICPDADIKFFICATAQVRARRRYIELLGRGVKTNLEKVSEEIIRRDEIDSKRDHSPLLKATDAILIDTSLLSIEQAFKIVEEFVKKELKKSGS